MGQYLFLVNKERMVIERQAELSVSEITDTYEARVVRALREIDTALKLVRFTANSSDYANVLGVLNEQRLLPPALLFTISIVDAQGRIVETTDSGRRAAPNAPSQAVLDDDYLAVWETDAYQATQLTFARPLMSQTTSEEGAGTGWVVIAIDANYFVSSYEVGSLGQQGMLALVGTGGEVLVRLTGEATYSGELMDIAAWKSSTLDAVSAPF
ncbi:hypothetical protein HORIV_27430 [Vreelandella olivaria]|uniref:Uncharacterized protein n=1 Tax=Vreelandella olivaria TaxID=390919 RepID=A0ABN5WTU0_9GAMM|nr:hypothetical protein HORIV_27430 [Halomonas olivaria]